MANALNTDKQIAVISALAEGSSEVFDLTGHPKTHRVYAWAHETEQGKRRHVTVLHIPPAISPETAVRAAIIQEYRNRGTAEN